MSRGALIPFQPDGSMVHACCRDCTWFGGGDGEWSRCERAASLSTMVRYVDSKSFAMSRQGEGWQWVHQDHGCAEFRAK